ncbi:hypothetical protein ACU686_07800 [Yinghuangia aomiensis]
MRSARTRLAYAALASCLLLGVSACKFGSDDKDKKAGDAAVSASSAPSAAASGPSAPASGPASPGSPGAGSKALTSADLKAALVTQQEMGTGWTAKPNTGDVYGSITMTAVPANAQCQPLLDLMAGAKPASAAYAGEILTTAADKHTSISLDLVRFQSQDEISQQLAAVAKLRDAHDCLEMTATNTKGQKTEYPGDVGRPPAADGRRLGVGQPALGRSEEHGGPELPGAVRVTQFVRVGPNLVKYDGRPESTSYSAEFVPDAQVKAQVDGQAHGGHPRLTRPTGRHEHPCAASPPGLLRPGGRAGRPAVSEDGDAAHGCSLSASRPVKPLSGRRELASPAPSPARRARTRRCTRCFPASYLTRFSPTRTNWVTRTAPGSSGPPCSSDLVKYDGRPESTSYSAEFLPDARWKRRWTAHGGHPRLTQPTGRHEHPCAASPPGLHHPEARAGLDPAASRAPVTPRSRCGFVTA